MSKRRRKKNHVTNAGLGESNPSLSAGCGSHAAPHFSTSFGYFSTGFLAVIYGVNSSRILLQSQWKTTFIRCCGIFQSNGSTCVFSGGHSERGASLQKAITAQSCDMQLKCEGFG